jgi:deazaflavin-dependent oxidoreductase (nitroreductase family)
MVKKSPRRIPDFVWRWMKPFNNRVAKIYTQGFRAKEIVLLLTTTGRKSGQLRVTPLQFEEIEGAYYVGSARGDKADWFKNIVANPNVRIQLQDRSFQAFAEPITDPIRIADFFEIRLQRHPKMIGRLMRLEGLPANHSRSDLVAFANDKAIVIIHPCSAKESIKIATISKDD